jgi:hypothetical protein
MACSFISSKFESFYAIFDAIIDSGGVWVEQTVFGMCGTLAMTFFARRAGYRTVRGV